MRFEIIIKKWHRERIAILYCLKKEERTSLRPKHLRDIGKEECLIRQSGVMMRMRRRTRRSFCRRDARLLRTLSEI